ncbi:hypothetical protein [Virgibacillus sp. DJP39]|uniref:hypothetical protein n=1 Tax=Virgibacillus sp. DJP39 TaxID=3409790 RepID=UPI003BB5B841
MTKKKFEIIYSSVVLMALIPLIFPLFEIANRVTPIVLGLPFNFFWVILWVLIVFVAVTCLYFIDPDKENDGGVE